MEGGEGAWVGEGESEGGGEGCSSIEVGRVGGKKGARR